MRRYRFAILAVVLLVLAAYLMHGEEPEKAEARVKNVHLPRFPTPEEYQRRNARRTLVELAAENQRDPEEETAARDPLHEVLPYDEKEGAVIVEASAIRFSELGEKILDCLGSDTEGFKRIKEETGIDVLENLDRVGISGETMVVSGRFEGLNPKDAKLEPYGDHAKFFVTENGERHGAVWKDELFIFNDSEEEVKLAIDRLEGRAPRQEKRFPDHLAYGEIYGWLPVDVMARLVPDDGPNGRLGERLREVAEKVELHVSVEKDVGIVARVLGKNDGIAELGKSIGGAMALGRVFARNQNEEDLAEILELARVAPRGDAFDVELALPSELLMKHIASECAPKAGHD
jgi:hypothetical protein